MLKIDFSDLKGYSQFRREWREEYKALSQKIRELKSQRKEYKWEYRAKDDTTSKRRIKVGPNPNYHPYAAGNAMYERFKAHQMMELLNEAKAKRDIIILSEDGDDRKAA
jgi:hypothetical protein